MWKIQVKVKGRWTDSGYYGKKSAMRTILPISAMLMCEAGKLAEMLIVRL